PVVVDIAEQQVAAFMPPQRSLCRALRSAIAVGEVLDRLARRDDGFQRAVELLDARRQIVRHCRSSPTRSGARSSRRSRNTTIAESAAAMASRCRSQPVAGVATTNREPLSQQRRSAIKTSHWRVIAGELA